MQSYKKLTSKKHPGVILRVHPGHFVTPNAHTNYFMDMNQILRRQTEAQAAAHAMAEFYKASTVIDTIVCLDGMDIIGAYLAEELTRAGIISQNAHKSMYIVEPEYDAAGQMFFRDNIAGFIAERNVLILLASATTGATIARAGQAVNFYGGKVTGISAIFSAVSRIDGYPVYALFDQSDIPDYKYYSHEKCPMCRAGQRVDAICNGFGYSEL